MIRILSSPNFSVRLLIGETQKSLASPLGTILWEFLGLSSHFTWEDLSTLAVCLALDLLDYLVPFLATPIYGDILDFTGIAFCILFFNWIGTITILEIVPGLDILPLYSISWFTWYMNISRERKKHLQEQLDQWR
ncbi:hypothetical protein ACFL0D_02295 [Thermoproteota archaeon]